MLILKDSDLRSLNGGYEIYWIYTPQGKLLDTFNSLDMSHKDTALLNAAMKNDHGLDYVAKTTTFGGGGGGKPA